MNLSRIIGLIFMPFVFQYSNQPDKLKDKIQSIVKWYYKVISYIRKYVNYSPEGFKNLDKHILVEYYIAR